MEAPQELGIYKMCLPWGFSGVEVMTCFQLLVEAEVLVLEMLQQDLIVQKEKHELKAEVEA